MFMSFEQMAVDILFCVCWLIRIRGLSTAKVIVSV
jgi:hypothetical protein